ncbi:hypothetical protein PBY51_009008 [Eleginops maclovinus]|uniref:Uromodulin-like 1 n=1 Tax=Eleginops maclovinus TaxID=56733 RepID=A0AAN8A2Z3_ELEMC|nr:hypothetical protein PBY51_009008 [Eleginops maclovinus]
MLSFAGITQKKNSLEFSFIFFILVPHTISLGRCDDISFSICWMNNNHVLERQEVSIWLNDTALGNLRKGGKVTSLTVSPGVENKLTLQYGLDVEAWTFRINPRTKFMKIRGRQKPQERPTSGTKGVLELLGTTEVFACENGTLFLHQDDNFFIAIGHTMRLPVKLESRSPSMLLVSWVENRPSSTSSTSHTVNLFHSELGSYSTLSMDTTSDYHYRFTALESCTSYVACVETAGAHTLTCLSTLTDPGTPKDFEVTSFNSSSMSLAWDCPENNKYSFYLLTTFHLDGRNHVTEEVLSLHNGNDFVFALSDLEPCGRVRFGLQTVCQAGIESRYSKMVLNEGNSAHSSIVALRQTAFGPDNYTLRWEVRNMSSVASFRVYHQGALQGTTLLTSHTVGGLLPCQLYEASVEALCGDGVLLSTKTITAHTGPHGVTELTYRSNDSTAQWTPSGGHRPAVAFLYELSLENGTAIQSSSVADPELSLLGLEEGKTYLLDVWEECGLQWQSERSRLFFEGSNASFEILGRAAAPSSLDHELMLDFSITVLKLVLPWSLPEDLQDYESEPRAKMGNILKDKLEELLSGLDPPARVEVATFDPADDPDKTEVLFMSFDASTTDKDIPLPVEDQLDYIRSLNRSDWTVTDGVLHWDGPDLCASFQGYVCPSGSLCINTFGSYTCVCKHGHYDVSSVSEPLAASHPVCTEKGLFSQCLDRLVIGAIAKPYLRSSIGGKVDVRLNDGRCDVKENEMFYYFRFSRSACGTERRVNKSHIEIKNTLYVTLTKEETISRRDLRVVWTCLYPRHYVRNAQVRVDKEWVSSVSLVEFNSSLQLGLTMTLFTDESYTSRHSDAVTIGPEESLFLQVALQTNNSFAADVLLQVESCWATESTDPQEIVQGVLLQDGCAVDDTFHWLSVNGLAQRSRFSIQMFTMPRGLPLYIHCLANICGHHEECAKLSQRCSGQQRPKRSASQVGRAKNRAAVVSAGPLMVNQKGTSGVPPSYWADHMTMITIVAGSIGFLGVTVLTVSASKAVMSYFERLRRQ